MTIDFSKYQGAGNDFIIIDNRSGTFTPNTELIKSLCDRHFGIGADGLMLLESTPGYDFYMRYFNSDGNESTMCGNGGRCITLFAKQHSLIDSSAKFMGIDGEHKSEILDKCYVKLKMQDVNNFEVGDDYYFIDTGSPHFVYFVDDVTKIDVNTEGRLIRKSHNINNGGTNVNFVQPNGNKIKLRTYERGVEGETLACGTGSVATAIAFNHYFESEDTEFIIHTLGGELKVSFTKKGESEYENIWLEGPAMHVFDGKLEI